MTHVVTEEDVPQEQRHMVGLNAELARVSTWPTM